MERGSVVDAQIELEQHKELIELESQKITQILLRVMNKGMQLSPPPRRSPFKRAPYNSPYGSAQ